LTGEVGTASDLGVAAVAGAPGTVVKRTICKFWEQNLCQRGELCTFAHGEKEIGTAVLTAAVPIDNAQPPPIMGARSFSAFQPARTSGGGGGVSSWASTPLGNAMAALPAAPWRQSQPPPQQHVPNVETEVRRTICKFWLSGNCSKAPGQCTFAHGEHEIGTTTSSASPAGRISSGGWEPQIPQVAEPVPDIDAKVRRSICKFWLAGTCREAPGECTWAHGEQEIGMPIRAETRSPQIREPVLAIAARMPQAALRSDAPAVRRTVCKFWEVGTCREAPGQCTFAHGEHEIGTMLGAPVPEPTVRRSICKFWQAGICREAPGQCTFAHGEHEIGTMPGALVSESMVRRSICKFWQAGICREAPGQCTFAHGEHEVGTVPGMMPWSHTRSAAMQQQQESVGAVVHAGWSDAPVPSRPGEESVRRTICKFWQAGSCSKAPGQCTFAHGEHELGTNPGQMRLAAAPQAGSSEQDQQVRRTICKFWQAGTCSKAPGQCSFAHGEHEIGTAPRESMGDPISPRNGAPAWAAPFDVAVAAAAGGAGAGDAPVRRTLCRFWQIGSCGKPAGQCLWAHGAEEIGTVVGAPPRRGETRQPCRFHASGFCNKGLDCPFAHILEEDSSGAVPWQSTKRLRVS